MQGSSILRSLPLLVWAVLVLATLLPVLCARSSPPALQDEAAGVRPRRSTAAAASVALLARWFREVERAAATAHCWLSKQY